MTEMMKSMTDQLAAISAMRSSLEQKIANAEITELAEARRFLETWETALFEMVGQARASVQEQSY